jgi:hypothetical protein
MGTVGASVGDDVGCFVGALVGAAVAYRGSFIKLVLHFPLDHTQRAFILLHFLEFLPFLEQNCISDLNLFQSGFFSPSEVGEAVGVGPPLGRSGTLFLIQL